MFKIEDFYNSYQKVLEIQRIKTKETYLNQIESFNKEINAIEYNATNGTPAPNQLPSTNPNPGTWLSFDIPLSSFTIAGGGSAARNNLAEFIISTNLGTVYYDNAYFHKGTTLGLSSFETPEVKTMSLNSNLDFGHI